MGGFGILSLKEENITKNTLRMMKAERDGTRGREKERVHTIEGILSD